MLIKNLPTRRPSASELEGTGTFADGIFPLISTGQFVFDREHGLRASYGRDESVNRKREQAPPAYA